LTLQAQRFGLDDAGDLLFMNWCVVVGSSCNTQRLISNDDAIEKAWIRVTDLGEVFINCHSVVLSPIPDTFSHILLKNLTNAALLNMQLSFDGLLQPVLNFAR